VLFRNLHKFRKAVAVTFLADAVLHCIVLMDLKCHHGFPMYRLLGTVGPLSDNELILGLFIAAVSKMFVSFFSAHSACIGMCRQNGLGQCSHIFLK